MFPLVRAPVPARKWLCCAALAAALLLCPGCGQHPAQAPAASSAGVEVISPVSSAVEETPVREPLSAVTAISPASTPTFVSLGGGLVLSCWADFSYNGEECRTCLDVIDLAQDRVVRSTAADSYVELVRGFSDGTALLRSYEQDCFFLLDETLHRTRLDLPTTDGQFSRDHSRYYFLQEEALYVLDLSSGEQTVLPLDSGVRLALLSGIHPDRDILYGWVYISLYSMNTCYAVIDCQSGQILTLQQDMGTPVFFDESFQSMLNNYSDGSKQLLWGELLGDTPLQRVDLSRLEDMYAYLQPLPNSGYFIRNFDSTWSETEPEGYRSAELYRLEEAGVSVCDLRDYGFEYTLDQAAYLPEEELILASSYQEEGYVITLIDLSLLTFTDAGLSPSQVPERVDQDILDACLAELALPELAPELAGVRSRADELEARYGVHILLSNQCEAPCAVSGYDVTTTDQSGGENEAAAIDRALGQLETALAAYPEGYFGQFCTQSEYSGVYLMLVGSIDSDFQIGVAALEFGLGMREYIALDISFYDLSYNIYHEIWHATENKINRTDYIAFYDGSWDACNPEGFSYLYSYDIYSTEEDLWQWTYFGGSDEVYFVDDYSHTYAKEDRARIMEYVMGDDFFAQKLLESPYIREKLRLMSDGIRAAFDTTGWEDVRWERFS